MSWREEDKQTWSKGRSEGDEGDKGREGVGDIGSGKEKKKERQSTTHLFNCPIN